jgi:hypothetical protein
MPWPAGTIFLVSLLLAASPGWAAAGTQSPAGNSPSPQTSQKTSQTLRDQEIRDLEALRQLEANYLRAEMEDSAQLAGSILADDYLGLNADGTAASKSDVLNSLDRHERTRHPYNVTANNLQEHIFGDTACVTYTKIYTLPNNSSYSEDVLHIFTKRNGAWHLQVSSPIPKPRPLASP